VQAARDLRENADHYYGSATAGEAWTQLLTDKQLVAVRAIIRDAREERESEWLSDPPEDRRASVHASASS
jgi:hypothetical protein